VQFSNFELGFCSSLASVACSKTSSFGQFGALKAVVLLLKLNTSSCYVCLLMTIVISARGFI
jgi:hypothetical protein